MRIKVWFQRMLKRYYFEEMIKEYFFQRNKDLIVKIRLKWVFKIK